MKNFLIFISMLFFIGGINSQNDIPRKEKIASKIEAQRIAFITEVLDLSPEESQKFWPLYNEYMQKARLLNKEQKEHRPQRGITDEEATKSIDFFFANEQKKLTLKKNYYDKFMMILPSTKVVKLHFAENKFKKKLLKRLKKRRMGKKRFRD